MHPVMPDCHSNQCNNVNLRYKFCKRCGSSVTEMKILQGRYQKNTSIRVLEKKLKLMSVTENGVTVHRIYIFELQKMVFS